MLMYTWFLYFFFFIKTYTRIFLVLFFFVSLNLCLPAERNGVVGMIDRLDGIKRDKEIKCTRIRQPSLPFVQITTRYACNYAQASNFVCARLKWLCILSLCHRIFQHFFRTKKRLKWIVFIQHINHKRISFFSPKYSIDHWCKMNLLLSAYRCICPMNKCRCADFLFHFCK